VSDHDRLRGYLLGELSESEAEELEQRLLVDEDLAQRLDLEQDALVEAHLRSALSPAESARLEKRARSNPELQRHLHHAGLLYRRLAPVALHPPARRRWAAAAAVLLAAGAAWWLQVRSPAAPRGAAGPPVAPRSVAPSTPASPPHPVRTASLTLSPGQTMAEAGADVVAPAPGVTRLHLELLLEPPLARAYAVELWDESDREVWRKGRSAPAVRAGALIVEVPVERLPPGRYRLELAPEGASSSDRATYYFEVRRP
jgi:hypothetical protein